MTATTTVAADHDAAMCRENPGGLLDFDQLPLDWQAKIRELRANSCRYRIERNQLREELKRLRSRRGERR